MWHDCKDTKPPKGHDVLVYCADTGETMVAFRRGRDGEFQFGVYPTSQGMGALVCRPSHWRELPHRPAT